MAPPPPASWTRHCWRTPRNGIADCRSSTRAEGKAIQRIYAAVDEPVDGLLMNPAGFCYAGYALRDCLRAVPLPCVEVHMTNLDKRGMHSVTAEAAIGVVTGFGTRSYWLGLDGLLQHLSAQGGKP